MGEGTCRCDLATEGSAEWWIDLPGLHHLRGCPMRPPVRERWTDRLGALVRRVEIAFTCNWLSIAAACALRGHEWRTQRPTRCMVLVDCARCGHCRGYSVTDGATCRWYRSPQ